MILTTADGGKTWNEQNSGTKALLESVFFNADGQRGWAVGNGGTIVSTTDGGITWSAQSSGMLENLTSIFFTADGLRGWTVGYSGTILSTTDGGKNWNSQISGSEQLLFSVFFTANGQRGWIVGYDGTILATTDGGVTWNAQPSGVQDMLLSVFFDSDGRRGWAVGNRGTILRTDDSGKTWYAQKEGKQEFRSVYFTPDGQRGWIVGEGGTILASTDSGKTWDAQTSGAKEALDSIFFAADGQRGCAVGGETILTSTNGGSTWNRQTKELQFLNLIFLTRNGEHCWTVGDSGVILNSTNRGKTWNAQTSGTSVGLRSVYLTDDGRNGWVAGLGGTILNSTDGGTTWHAQSSGTTAELYSVSFSSDGKQGCAVGAGGTIINTNDGGKTWKQQTSGTDALLYSVLLTAGGRRGWAVGGRGTILITTDGGNTWDPHSNEIDEVFNSVFFIDNGQRGWVVGNGGTILNTSDSGATWHAQTSDTQKVLLSVFFMADGQRGWATGDGGTILSSKNGGRTWDAQSSGTAQLLASVVFHPNGEDGWIVGSGGTFLSTSDGGKAWNVVKLYRRAPAPIYFVLLALTLVPLGFAVRKVPPPRVESESIASIYVSDAALSAEDAAGTQLGAVSAGLASYIENPKTQAPLVIGITGPWGSGKSSLMGVLRDHLRARGFQTAWFNAWHHQSEEHLFASLLATLRSKALPPWWSARGLYVRWRLLLERCERMWLRLLLGLAGAVFVGTVVTQLDPDSTKVAEWTSLEKVLSALTLPAALLPIFAASRVFSAFGVESTKLIDLLRGRSVAKAQAGTSLREQFAQEFAEVTRALQPKALTIFIDDLDRCRPDQMYVMLEAINFLASSGSCYIVLGMEQQVVLRCLEKKLQEEDLRELATATPGVSRAQLWLEKLVQLRLFVAPLPSEEMKALYDSRAGRTAKGEQPLETDWDRLKTRLPRFAKATAKVVATLLLIAGIGVGAWWVAQKVAKHLQLTSKEKPAPPSWLSEIELAGKLNNTDVALRIGPITTKVGAAEAQVTPSPPDVTSTEPESTTGTLPPSPNPNRIETEAITLKQGEKTSPDWWGLGAAALAMLLIATGARRVMSIRDLTRIEDSKTFRTTLNDFTPCIEAACKTPRAVKQLINRIRLYAMLLRHWTTSDNAPAVERRLKRQEANIVIFGILQKLCPAQLAEALKHPATPGLRLETIEPEFELAEFNDRANQAIRTLAGTKMRKDFDRLLRSIELD